jgi:hypothetical protein
MKMVDTRERKVLALGFVGYNKVAKVRGGRMGLALGFAKGFGVRLIFKKSR